MPQAESVLLLHEDRSYLCEPGTELQTDLGVLTIPTDVEHGDRLESHLGTTFRVRRPRLADLFDHLERTGAPMLPRDVGLVIGLTGAQAGDLVLDAGTGTGILAVALGRLDARVITFERNADAAEVARSNMQAAGVSDRVEVRTADVVEALDGLQGDGPFDLVTLDMGDAHRVVARADDLLEEGGFLAVYSPFVEDVRRVEETARDVLSDVETLETIQRRMDVDPRGTRPTPSGVGHSGYLTVARRS